MSTRTIAACVVMGMALAGCGGKGVAGPSAIPAAAAASGGGASGATVSGVMANPNPVWTGTTTPDDGAAPGAVTLTFGDQDTVRWAGATGTFSGVMTGALPELTVTAMGGANGCVYTAQGTVSGGVYSGRYTQGGAASCIDKSGVGSFRVTQGAPPLVTTSCPAGVTGHIVTLTQGGVSTATVRVPAGEQFTISLVSYKTPGATGTTIHRLPQFIVDQDVRTIGPGDTTFKVNVAPCYYQVDLVCGDPIVNLSATDLYGVRALDYRYGGTNACK